MRLLIAHVVEMDDLEPQFRKISLVRAPIRLGQDVFSETRMISDEHIDRMVHAFCGFDHLMKAHMVIDHRAYATSAMREARNANDVIARVKDESGIDIEVIDGSLEAKIIYANKSENLIRSKAPALYVDVGGGSTEVTLFIKRKRIESKSFKIGTVRVLHGQTTEDEWQAMKRWIIDLKNQYDPEYVIGTGGNINTIMKLSSASKRAKYLTIKEFEEVYEELARYTYNERIYKLSIKPDRADVIIPAADVFRSILNWSGCKRVYVPQVGLADGIIHELYARFKGADVP